MNGSDRLRELIALIRQFHDECGGCPVEDLCDAADITADLGDALRLIFNDTSGRRHGMVCSCGFCGMAGDALARLDAWGTP